MNKNIRRKKIESSAPQHIEIDAFELDDQISKSINFLIKNLEVVESIRSIKK